MSRLLELIGDPGRQMTTLTDWHSWRQRLLPRKRNHKFAHMNSRAKRIHVDSVLVDSHLEMAGLGACVVPLADFLSAVHDVSGIVYDNVGFGV